MRKIKILLCILSFNLVSFTFARETQPMKIVALVMARNEENIIEQYLRGLEPYVDTFLVLDDASNDSTPEIVKNLAYELPIERLIINKKSAWEHTTEAHNMEVMLTVGREIGGTHFVFLGVDEMFTAPCMKDNWLRKKISSLAPGQALIFQMTHLWRGFENYRNDHTRWSPHKCRYGCIFYDDGQCNYEENLKKSDSGFIHVYRLPFNRKSQEKDILITDINYNLMHFRFVNWHNNAIKQAWYMCLELIRSRENTSYKPSPRTAQDVNFYYKKLTSFNEKNIHLTKANPEWFDYPFFDPTCYKAEVRWRKNQVLQWFDQYGRDFFKELDIWQINWDS